MGNAHSDPSFNPDGDYIPHNKTYFLPIFGHPNHSDAFVKNSTLQVTDNNLFGSFILTPLHQPISSGIPNCELLDRFGILPSPGQPDSNALASLQSKYLWYDSWGCGQKYTSYDKIPLQDHTPLGTPYYHSDYASLTTSYSVDNAEQSNGKKLPEHFQPIIVKYLNISPNTYDGVCIIPEIPSKSNPPSTDVSRIDSTDSASRQSMIASRMSMNNMSIVGQFSSLGDMTSNNGVFTMPTLPIPFLKIALNQSNNTPALLSTEKRVESFPTGWLQLQNVANVGQKVISTVNSFRSKFLPLSGLHPSKPPLSLDFNFKTPNGPWIPDEPSTVGSKGQPLWAPNGLQSELNYKVFFTQIIKKQLACPPPVMFSVLPIQEYNFTSIAQLQHTIHQPAFHVGTILILDFFAELASLTLSNFIHSTSSLLTKGCPFSLIDVPIYIILLQDSEKLHLEEQGLTRIDIIDQLTHLGFGHNNIHFFSPKPVYTLTINDLSNTSTILNNKAILEWKDHNEISNQIWSNSILKTHFLLHKLGAFRSFFNTTRNYRPYNLLFPARWPSYYKGDCDWNKLLWNIITSQKIKLLDFDPPTWSKSPISTPVSPVASFNTSTSSNTNNKTNLQIKIINNTNFSKFFQQITLTHKLHESDPLYHPLLLYLRSIQHYFFAMRCSIDINIHPITSIYQENSNNALIVAAAAIFNAHNFLVTQKLTPSTMYPPPQPTPLVSLFSGFNQLIWADLDPIYRLMYLHGVSPSVTPKVSISLQQRPILNTAPSGTSTITLNTPSITTTATNVAGTAGLFNSNQVGLTHIVPFLSNPLPDKIINDTFDYKRDNYGVELPIEYCNPYSQRIKDGNINNNDNIIINNNNDTTLSQIESPGSNNTIFNGTALGEAKMLAMGERSKKYHFQAFVLFSDHTLISDHDNTMPLSAYRFSNQTPNSSPVNRFASTRNLNSDQGGSGYGDTTNINTSLPPQTSLATYLSKTTPQYPPQIHPSQYQQIMNGKNAAVASYSVANPYGGNIVDINQLNMEIILKKYMSFYYNSYNNLDNTTDTQRYIPQARSFPSPPKYLTMVNEYRSNTNSPSSSFNMIDDTTKTNTNTVNTTDTPNNTIKSNPNNNRIIKSITPIHTTVQQYIDLNELSIANQASIATAALPVERRQSQERRFSQTNNNSNHNNNNNNNNSFCPPQQQQLFQTSQFSSPQPQNQFNQQRGQVNIIKRSETSSMISDDETMSSEITPEPLHLHSSGNSNSFTQPPTPTIVLPNHFSTNNNNNHNNNFSYNNTNLINSNTNNFSTSSTDNSDLIDITITYTTKPTDDGIVHSNGIESANALLNPSPSLSNTIPFTPLHYLYGAIVIPFTYTRALSLINTDIDLVNNPPRSHSYYPKHSGDGESDNIITTPQHTAVDEQDREIDEEKGIYYYPSFTKPPIPSLLNGYYDAQTQSGNNGNNGSSSNSKPLVDGGDLSYPNGSPAPMFPPQSIMDLFHSNCLVENEFLLPFNTSSTSSSSSSSSSKQSRSSGHLNRLSTLNLPNLTPMNCPITFIVTCSNDIVDDDLYELAYYNFITRRRYLAHQRNVEKKKQQQNAKPSSSSNPLLKEWERSIDEVKEPLKRSHYEWFLQNIPKIYKYELIYRYFFPSSLPHLNNLEQLWDVKFIHVDNLPLAINAVERRAIHTRMELYKNSISNYHNNVINLNPYHNHNMNAIQE